jgi:hypothetical protein
MGLTASSSLTIIWPVRPARGASSMTESLSEIHYWFSGTPLFVAGSFILSICLGLIAIRDVLPPVARTLLWVLAVELMLFGWSQSAKQEKDNEGTSRIIPNIADAMGLKLGTPPTQLVDLIRTQKQLYEAVTGGDHIGFFCAVTHKFDNDTKLTQLQINGSGGKPGTSYWISPASAQRNPDDQRYWSLDKAKPPVIISKGSFWFGRALPLGSYFIEFSTPYQAWVEKLEIAEVDGNYRQSITITKVGSKYIQRVAL